MNDERSVPFHRATIGQEEIDEVVQTLRSGWLTSGPRTNLFENAFREYVRAPHALAVNSCTAGLHLALAALRIGPGDEVITTPLTFCATVNVILHVGATPVLADVGPDGNIDPARIAEKITSKTSAIMPVHYAGLPVDMDAVWKLARRHRLYVIEDCAHAAGAHYKGWPIGAGRPDVGYFSDAAAFSFYATKNLTTGEGGMVTTHEGEVAERMRLLCLHGISKDAWNRYSERGNWFYSVLDSGFKYNLSDIQSAIGIHQLRKLDGFTARRADIAKLYRELLGDIEELELPVEKADCRHAWHLYMLRLRLERCGISRDEFIRGLRDRGVGTSVHFIPIPMHPFFEAHAAGNECPAAMAMYRRIVSLPLYPAMSDGDVEYVASAVRSLVVKAQKTRLFVAAGG